MEAAPFLRSLPGGRGTLHVRRGICYKTPLTQISMTRSWLVFSTLNPKGSFVASANASVIAAAAKSELENISAPLEKRKLQTSTFPVAFEKLVQEVCDETDVAEVTLKVGDFEMHLKRNIGDVEALKSPAPIVSPTTAPPIPSEPMVESDSTTLPTAPEKSSAAMTKYFTNMPPAKASKLAALDASGSNTYVLVSSPTVGSFRSGRTIKGKKQPPSCKAGDLIKEGQVIGYVDQFSNELPVKSDVAGEVLKVLYKDGEAVGFGDPLIAVLPSFHGIKI